MIELDLNSPEGKAHVAGCRIRYYLEPVLSKDDCVSAPEDVVIMVLSQIAPLIDPTLFPGLIAAAGYEIVNGLMRKIDV